LSGKGHGRRCGLTVGGVESSSSWKYVRVVLSVCMHASEG
jgi:hypothetical protein